MTFILYCLTEKSLSAVRGNYDFGRILDFPYYGGHDEESSEYFNAMSKLHLEELLNTRIRLTENLRKHKNPIVLCSTFQISSIFNFPVALQTSIKWNSESSQNISQILSQSTSS